MAALVKVAAAFLGLISIVTAAEVTGSRRGHDYGDALSKSILFFEGQRSGKLPTNQRLTWRRDSALKDGSDHGVDLTGGYYDAGDNVKYSFPMAFSATMLAWSVVEYGGAMGEERRHALEAVRWATDFLLKATEKTNVVYALVGVPVEDHHCWERPEDMDTPRTSFAVTDKSPGSEVSAEIAAAMAAASLAFKASDPRYSKLLLQRASKDELVWAAAWLHKATNNAKYWNYVKQNIQGMSMATSAFGWESKHAGINVLVSQFILNNDTQDFNPFIPNADALVCNVLPESPSKSEKFTPGGLMFVDCMCNLQRSAAVSFLFVTYGTYLQKAKRTINCGNVVVTPARLIEFAKFQVDYILGNNPMNMSYMVGYGKKYPERAHHRGASLPSIGDHPEPMGCSGWSYLNSSNPNLNLLVGAVVGGPDGNDQFADNRRDAKYSEPTTYVNAPLVGILAYFKAH
nr:endoglucanase 4-like [Ipomoea batatas]